MLLLLFFITIDTGGFLSKQSTLLKCVLRPHVHCKTQEALCQAEFLVDKTTAKSNLMFAPLCEERVLYSSFCIPENLSGNATARIMDEGTIKTPIPQCRLYCVFLWGGCSNFVGSDSGQKQSVKLLQNMVYNKTQHPPHPLPHCHTLSVCR